MASGVALSVREFPSELLERPDVQRRLFGRGGDAEVRFWFQDRLPLLPIWHGQRFILARWGSGSRRNSNLPSGGWVWNDELDRWSDVETHQAKILANAAHENGVWYRVRQGIEGLLVFDENDQPVVYMLVTAASHYFHTMTRSRREPVLIGETI